MKKLIIDRYEGKYAICEDGDKRAFAIETAELPTGAVVGSVIDILDSGELALNEQETKERRERIAKKQNRAFK